MLRSTLHPFLAGLLATCLVALALGMVWFGLSLQQGHLPPFMYELALDRHSQLTIRYRHACPSYEPTQLCYYRLMYTPPSFHMALQNHGVRHTLAFFELSEPQPASASSW